ncbi:DUF3626 domain-containing protein [Pseudactinotalea sp.]|uniref:DUF3626 domain-containing protein n=1 Tax=Pseudactinotalea sp. TaxID=1926260 RepID=UPI003B3A95EC
MHRSDTNRAHHAVDHVHSLASSTPTSLADVLARARVTVTFHPDRPGQDGRTAAAGMAADGVYRTQFETGTSSGGLESVLRGARSGWERVMFAGAYDGAAPAERPRYGGLDLLPYPNGACPRFGSTHLRLRSHVLNRCTFSWGDSVTEPSAVGTWDRLGRVLAAAASAGAPEVSGRARVGADRVDGDIIEAQVHGGLHLRDVEAVVTDPAYRGTAVEHDLRHACERFGARLEWHTGYALPAADLDPEFRGPEPIELARAIAERFARDALDPELLGRAAAAMAVDPQHLKYVWHHLAAFGYPAHRA